MLAINIWKRKTEFVVRIGVVFLTPVGFGNYLSGI
jgi:hypothetical protein